MRPTRPDKSTRKIIAHGRRIRACYTPVNQRLLPLDDAWRRELAAIPWPTGNFLEVMNDHTKTLLALVREYLFVSLYSACAESLASENASRLAAMRRAEKNINELLVERNQTFQRLRQSGSDKEQFDVIADFEALGMPIFAKMASATTKGI